MNTEIEIGISDGFGNITCSKIINNGLIGPSLTEILQKEYNKLNYYYNKYGENYKEVIQKKWDMRKLRRKLKIKLLQKKQFKTKVKKI